MMRGNKKMNQSLSILFILCCCFGGSSCLKEETIDKALIRAKEYLDTIKAHPEKDDGKAILSSPLVVDFGDMQIEEFSEFKSSIKVMLASVHVILKNIREANFDKFIAALNNVIVLKKPDDGFNAVKDFWGPPKFWMKRKKNVRPAKLKRLTKWFNSLVDDERILNTTKFMNSKRLNLFEMGRASMPYLRKACIKNPNIPAHRDIINLVVLQYPTHEDHQIKVYNIEMSAKKFCPEGHLSLHAKYQSHRFEAWKNLIKMMKEDVKKKVSKAMKTWINREAIRRLFDDDDFVDEKWHADSDDDKSE